MTKEMAAKVYDILAEECGANERNRDQFVYSLSRDRYIPSEYRFQGMLGFGGKFYHDAFDWRVDCYLEDETPDRDAMIKAANAKLSKLRRQAYATTE